MIATLAGEPWCKSIEEIRTLSDFQIKEILFHERDKEGRIKPAPRDDQPEMSLKEMHWEAGRMKNFPEWLIRKTWQEYLAAHPQQEQAPTLGEAFQSFN